MGAEALACCSVHPSQGRDPFTSFPVPLGSGKFPLGGFAPPLLNGVSLRSQQIWERPWDERSSTPLAGQKCWMISRSLDLFTHLSSRGPFVPSAFLQGNAIFFAFATRGAASRVPFEVSPGLGETGCRATRNLSRKSHALRVWWF